MHEATNAARVWRPSRGTPARRSTAPLRNRPLILISLLLAAFAINLDTTIVNVALPSIRQDLGFSETGHGWKEPSAWWRAPYLATSARSTSPRAIARVGVRNRCSGLIGDMLGCIVKTMMAQKARKKAIRETGLQAVGDLPWGSHFSIFYETKQDLLDILVPFFKAGLQNNESCLWIVMRYQFLTVYEAKDVLRKAVPDFDRLLREGKIEVVARKQWFQVDGKVDLSQAAARFQKKLDDALTRGSTGLRLTGSPAWIRNHLRPQKFREFEQEVDEVLANQRIIAACTFPLTLSGARQILDAARLHQFSVTVRKGVWKRVEVADIRWAKEESERTDPKIGQLTLRQREILHRISEGQNTKEIAGHLAISVKTVEAHRLQVMHRLKIHNVPGLVRFAIRTGLVSD